MTPSSQSLAGKKLLILDGSRKAIEIIDHARQMGVTTVVTDHSQPEQSPAKHVADRYFNISIADVDAVVRLIHDEGISGVLPGFSDRWLPTYGEICQRAGLPAYATTAQLKLFTDKKKYKKLLEKHGVPTIKGFTREQAEQNAIPSEDYPVLVKPADGSGSRGISLCKTPKELEHGLNVALDYSWTEGVVIERYIPGEEATAFWTMQDGEYFLTTIGNRHMHTFANSKARLPVGYTYPSYLIPTYLNDIAPRVRSMFKGAGLRNGSMFMQGIVDRGVFRTYDIGYRPTPTQEYRMIEALCGYNPMSILINFALTGSSQISDLKHRVNPYLGGYGFNVSTLVSPGTIESFVGIDEVKALHGVVSVSTSLSEGELLPAAALGQLRQVAVRTVGIARSLAELLSTMNEVVDTVDVLGPDGSSRKIAGNGFSELSNVLARPVESMGI